MSEIPIPDFTIVKPVLYNYLVNLKDDQEFLSYLIKVERYPFTYKQLLNLYDLWCQVGNLDLIKTAHLYTDPPIVLRVKHQAIAAKYNQLDLLRYFKSQNVPINDTVYNNVNSIKTAQWLKRNYPKLEPTYDAFVFMTENGYLDLLKYFEPEKEYITKLTFVGAANNGYLDILIYLSNLYNGNIPKITMEEILRAAIKNGYIDIVKWVPKKYYTLKTMKLAAEYGYLDIMKWLKENNCHWGTIVAELAAKGGYLKILKWLKENGCPMDNMVTVSAARYGWLKTLQWAVKNGIEMPGDILFDAIPSDNLYFIQWIYDQGYHDIPGDGLSSVKSSFEVLKWVAEKGARFEFEINGDDEDDYGFRMILKNFIIQKNKEAILWLKNRRIFQNIEGISVISAIMEYSDLDFFQFLAENGILDFNDHELGDFLINLKRLDILFWILEKYPEFQFRNDFGSKTTIFNNIDLTDWFVKKGYELDYNAFIFLIRSESGNIYFCDYLKSRGVKINTEYIFANLVNESLRYKDYEILKWIVKNAEVANKKIIIKSQYLLDGEKELLLYLQNQGFSFKR
jgi:hypothetical protein